MRFKLVGDKVDNLYRVGINSDATNAKTIPGGSPVVLLLNGTDDGLAFGLPSTVGAAAVNSLMFGITSRPAPYGTNVKIDVLATGIAYNALVNVGATKVSSGTSWPSYTSIAGGQALAVDVVNNVFGSPSALVSTGIKASYVLASSIASATTTPAAAGDSRTILSVPSRVWIQIM